MPQPPPGVLVTAACAVGRANAYALEASIFATGAAVQWLRDGLGIIERAEQTEALARELQGNDGVYFVPALTGLGSPHWDANARGTIVGLTRGSTRAHLARATLEAIAYQTVDAVRAMEAASPQPLSELRADGGASANAWLMQFQADVLGVPVQLGELSQMTALGAAYLAGVGSDAWTVEDLRAERGRLAGRSSASAMSRASARTSETCFSAAGRTRWHVRAATHERLASNLLARARYSAQMSELAPMREQVYTDPRPKEYFDRFHERARTREPDWVYNARAHRSPRCTPTRSCARARSPARTRRATAR